MTDIIPKMFERRKNAKKNISGQTSCEKAKRMTEGKMTGHIEPNLKRLGSEELQKIYFRTDQAKLSQMDDQRGYDWTISSGNSED